MNKIENDRSFDRQSHKSGADDPQAKVDPLRAIVECYSLKDGSVVEVHRIPQLGIVIGVDLSRDPSVNSASIVFIHKNDGSLDYYRTTNGPVASIATTNGRIILSTLGLQIMKQPVLAGEMKIKMISWGEPAEISEVLTQLAYKDNIFQSAVKFTQGAIIGSIDRCGSFNPSWVIQETVECVESYIPEIIQTVDRTVECLSDVMKRFLACNDSCDEKYVWEIPECVYSCGERFLDDSKDCVANGIIQIIVQAEQTVRTCVLRQGGVPGVPAPGDILVFVPDSIEGYLIDDVTCKYGYSHVALFCGSGINNVIDLTGSGVIQRPYHEIQQRKHSIVRIGLTNQQITDLCTCAASKVGQQLDYLELITFGTFGDPGREICTMLIMHCLDQIGFDRSSIGLGGFVSPNYIARLFGIRPGYEL